MKSTQSVVLCISDIHYGKRTRSYSTDIFVERVRRLSQSLIEARRNLGQLYTLTELVLFFLGDIVDGSLIYPGQAYEQDESSVWIQSLGLVDHLAEFIDSQKKVWPRVRCECVPGNHGRLKDASLRDNFDTIVYSLLQRVCRGVEVNVGDIEVEDTRIRKATVEGHTYLLTHGEQIRAYQSLPTYGITQRVLRWNAAESLRHFNVVTMGHFHSLLHYNVNSIPVLVNGAMTSDDAWALFALGWESNPAWWLFGVSPEEPITWLKTMALH